MSSQRPGLLKKPLNQRLLLSGRAQGWSVWALGLKARLLSVSVLQLPVSLDSGRLSWKLPIFIIILCFQYINFVFHMFILFIRL